MFQTSGHRHSTYKRQNKSVVETIIIETNIIIATDIITKIVETATQTYEVDSEDEIEIINTLYGDESDMLFD